MIEVEGLTKYFDSFRAIEDISFNIEKGEIVGLIGPNGSGKTTTMRILTCFMPPTKGTARIAGYDVIRDSLIVRKYIGYFPEGAPLYSNLPVETYLEFVAEVKGIDSSMKRKKIAEVMELCGITHVAKRYIENLSKGYRQRVCLAQAILNDPACLILDEPTVGLDPEQVVEVRNLIKELSGQRTVILSTHILSEVSMICDRVFIINKGRLIAQDTIENLSKKAEKERRLILKVKGEKQVVDRLLQDMGLNIGSVEMDMAESERVYRYTIETGGDVRDELSKKIISNNLDLLEIGFRGLTLEDIYINLIRENR
jgi:ABC-2 type transport system ATP-binding protein